MLIINSISKNAWHGNRTVNNKPFGTYPSRNVDIKSLFRRSSNGDAKMRLRLATSVCPHVTIVERIYTYINFDTGEFYSHLLTDSIFF
jgi:hypothetical protein